MSRTLWTTLAVVWVVLTCGGVAVAGDKPTITKATKTEQRNGTYSVAAEGTFPKVIGRISEINCVTEVRWVLLDEKGVVVKGSETPDAQPGRGNATNGDPTGKFDGVKTGTSSVNVKKVPQIRVKITGKRKGGGQEDFTDWSVWVTAK